MNKKQSILLLLLSLLPLIAFYGFEQLYGLKTAIAATIVVTVAEVIYRKWKKQDPGAFFYFISITTIGFGLIDVMSTNTRFFKFEPALTNLITGIYFAYGALTTKPMLQEMMEKMNRIPSERFTPELTAYFRFMTWVWVVYFIVKAWVYFIIAEHAETSVGKMMVIRTLAGNASMFGMLGVSWVLGKLYRWNTDRKKRVV